MKMWANSGDSHFLEPEDLWRTRLPARLADRALRTETDGDWETVHLDGDSIRRRRPTPIKEGEFKGMDLFDVLYRPPGARDVKLRLQDLDAEGVWGEVVYPSLGLWLWMVKDRELHREGVKVTNDWAAEEFIAASPRLIPVASLPTVEVEDSIAELHRVASMGFKAVCLPTRPAQKDYNSPVWEPLWSEVVEAGMVLSFHIGTDSNGSTAKAVPTALFGGPGGAILNYVETTYSGQRVATFLVRSGVFDRHPGLKVLISESGSSWVPFLADKMDEAYRQHGMFVKPKLSMLPSEYLYRHVYTSFQHDVSAVRSATAHGYQNVLWGSDYPHIEGTFGHTQQTLHELFDDETPEIRERLTVGAFLDLFPHIGEPPETLTSLSAAH
jgi:predicted TIM-barrel fold metal-dependent hydrolase